MFNRRKTNDKPIKKWRRLFSALCVCFCISVGGAVISANATSDSSYYLNVFDTNLVQMETNYLSESGQRGLLLSTKYEDSYAALSSSFCGDFETNFSFADLEEKYSVNELEIGFYDDSEKLIFATVVKKQASKVSVRVEINGESAGLVYQDGYLVEKTETENGNKQFTDIPVADSYYLRFDRDSGDVMFGNTSFTGNMVRVWNVFEREIDGKKCSLVPAFDDYSARFVFRTLTFPLDAYSKGKAGIIVYEINGKSLRADNVFDNSSAPDVYAQFDVYPVADKTYVLPEPSATDVLDGKIDDIYVTVRTESETVFDNIRYESELSFFPKADAVYTIEYSATNDKGLKGTFSKTVKALRIMPDAEFVFASGMPQNAVGVGSEIVLPEVYFASDLLLNDKTYNVSLKVTANGTVVKNYAEFNDFAGKTFVFEQQGNYVFAFNAFGSGFNETCNVNVTVSSTVPKIVLNGYVNSVYHIGDKVVFPSAEFSFGNRLLGYKAILYTSNNAAFDISGNSYEFTEIGEHVIEYRTVLDGNVYKYKQNFYVSDKHIYTQGCTYTEIVKAGQTVNEVSFYSLNDVLWSDRIIDLNEFSKDNPFFEFAFKPLEEGVPDCDRINLVLTDVNDETNYINIEVKVRRTDRNPVRYKVYVTGAPCTAEKLLGIQYRTYGTMKETAVGGHWGTMTEINPLTADQHVRLGYDTETNFLYVNERAYSSPDLEVIDFDSLKYFDTKWQGFSTNKVRLTITCSGIESKKAEIEIFNFGGIGKDDVSEIVIDTGNYSEYPTAVVGSRFSIFPAYAYVGGQKIPADVKVVYSTNQSVTLATDGKSFVPTNACDYRIIYSVKTGNGVIQKSMDVTAVDDALALSLSVEDGCEFVAGEKCALPIYSVENAIGTTEVTIEAEFNGIKEIVSGNYFVPDAIGEYKLYYTVKDYPGRTATETVIVQSVSAGKPVFVDPKFDYDVMINGRSYTIPEIIAIDYADGKKEITASVSVIIDGQPSPIERVFTPNVSESKEIIFRYTAEGTEGNAYADYPVTVEKILADDGLYCAEKLFVCDGVNVGTSSEGIRLSTSTEGASARFVNVLSDKDLTVNFTLPSSEFGKFNIYLSDGVNIGNELKISFEDMGDYVNVRINDTERTYVVSGSFGGDTKFDLTYTKDDCKLSNLAGELTHYFKLNLNGNDFNGFESGLVNVSFEFEDVAGTASVDIIYLCNQSFRNQINENGKLNDYFRPQISLLGDYGGMVSYGDVYKTVRAQAVDVISGVIPCTITCYAPSGGYAKDVSGREINKLSATEEYSMVFSEYGSYSFVYEAKDEKGIKETFPYIMTIIDTTPPVITVNGALNTVYRQGSKISLPGMTAEDNLDGEIKTYIIISTPDSLVKKYAGDGTYTFTQKGKYVISYYAVDASGNVSFENFNITVS